MKKVLNSLTYEQFHVLWEALTQHIDNSEDFEEIDSTTGLSDEEKARRKNKLRCALALQEQFDEYHINYFNIEGAANTLVNRLNTEEGKKYMAEAAEKTKQQTKLINKRVKG